MKIISLLGPFNQRCDAMLKFVRAHPVWTLCVLFFYMLGVMHAVDDLGHFAFDWNSKPGGEYKAATIFAVTMVLVLPILTKEIPPEECDAEKKILD
jgi:hypothetical protein